MNIQEKILNSTLRDATRIVSRKPHDSDGNNGDFAVGDTAGGVKLFAKVKNRWFAFNPRFKEPKSFLTTFQGGLFLINSGGRQHAHPNRVIDLGAGMNSHEADHRHINPDGEDNSKSALILPHDATIKRCLLRFSEAPLNGYTTVTLLAASNGNEYGDQNGTVWADGPSDQDDSLTGVVERVRMKIPELSEFDKKTLSFDFNQDIILKKGSIITMFMKTEDGEDTEVQQWEYLNWTIHVEFYE